MHPAPGDDWCRLSEVSQLPSCPSYISVLIQWEMDDLSNITRPIKVLSCGCPPRSRVHAVAYALCACIPCETSLPQSASVGVHKRAGFNNGRRCRIYVYGHEGNTHPRNGTKNWIPHVLNLDDTMICIVNLELIELCKHVGFPPQPVNHLQEPVSDHFRWYSLFILLFFCWFM